MTEQEKIKLLVFGDDPGVHTGFGEVSRYMLAALQGSGRYDIHLVALNWIGDEHDKKQYPYRYYRTSNDLRGIKRANELIARIQPDCVFLLNDPDWLFEYFSKNALLKEVPTVIYSPIDGDPFPVWWTAPFRLATVSCVYTEYGKRVLLARDPSLDLRVIPHGHDPRIFHKVDKTEARARLGVKEDWFIVLRSDRNTERKDWGGTLEAFAEFAKDKPEARLWAHCAWTEEPQGWVIPDMIEMYGLQGKVINSRGFDNMRSTLPASVLNLIFNAADVFISTTKGEGWGLNVHQARVCGLPVIATDCSSMPEVVGDGGELIKVVRRYLEPNGVVNSFCDPGHAAELLNRMYYNVELRQKYASVSEAWASEHEWIKIVPEFDRAIVDAINGFGNKVAQIKRWEFVQVDEA